jgi:GNAT superfamily N-acetyltransferase
MEVSVRRAGKGDANIVAEFAMKLFAQHREYDAERFADLSNIHGAATWYGSRTEADSARVFVAEIEGRVVGFAYLEYEEKDYINLLENAVWLHDIYVDESARGSGAGRALMNAVCDAARDFGAGKVVLTVAAKNSHSREFFARSGYRETMVEMTLGVGDKRSDG